MCLSLCLSLSVTFFTCVLVIDSFFRFCDVLNIMFRFGIIVCLFDQNEFDISVDS